MKRTLFFLTLMAAQAHPANAQGLREMIGQLFTYGQGCPGGDDQPLCVAENVFHGTHFREALNAGNLAVVDFVSEAVGKAVSNIPVASLSSATFVLGETGLAEITALRSAGPIFSERTVTLGKGKFFAGANISGIHFTSLSGIPADDILFQMTHSDCCAPTLGAGVLGLPDFERDIFQSNLLSTSTCW